ncbi:MAG TPA: MOSC domain-containing protein, partial [Rhizomicrobium sp.]|nr:MOSC domain-containing protein [Rhizomicrobium sp.]
MTDLDVIAVSIARARPIGELHGETVLSGIDKKTVTADVFVRKLGIEGDEQADLSVHGGLDKAVYAYPAEHWQWWEARKGLACRSATFG